MKALKKILSLITVLSLTISPLSFFTKAYGRADSTSFSSSAIYKIYNQTSKTHYLYSSNETSISANTGYFSAFKLYYQSGLNGFRIGLGDYSLDCASPSNIKLSFGMSNTCVWEIQITNSRPDREVLIYNQYYKKYLGVENDKLVVGEANSSSYTWNIDVLGDTINSGTYYAVNKNSNLFLDVKNASTLAGATVAQYIWNGNNNQKWKFTAAGDGYYYIIPMHATTKMLGTMSSTDNNKKIDMWSQGTSNNVKWKPIKNSDGSFRFVSKATNDSKTMVIKNGSTGEGAEIITYHDNGTDNGRWYLISASSDTSPSGDNKLYSTVNYKSKQNCFGYAIDVVASINPLYNITDKIESYGYTVTYYSTTFSKPQGNEKLIAYRRKNGASLGDDGHFMKWSNGIWTHKPGHTHPLRYLKANSDGSLPNTPWKDEGWGTTGWSYTNTSYTQTIYYIKYI